MRCNHDELEVFPISVSEQAAATLLEDVTQALRRGNRAEAILRLFDALTTAESRGRLQARQQAASMFCPWCAADVPYDRASGRHFLGDLSGIDAAMAEQLRKRPVLPESVDCRAGNLRSIRDSGLSKSSSPRSRSALM